jgi:hypothetical protein
MLTFAKGQRKNNLQAMTISRPGASTADQAVGGRLDCTVTGATVALTLGICRDVRGAPSEGGRE